MYNAKNIRYNFNNFIILYYSDYEIIIQLSAERRHHRKIMGENM